MTLHHFTLVLSYFLEILHARTGGVDVISLGVTAIVTKGHIKDTNSKGFVQYASGGKSITIQPA
jgi:hypothetical protein